MNEERTETATASRAPEAPDAVNRRARSAAPRGRRASRRVPADRRRARQLPQAQCPGRRGGAQVRRRAARAGDPARSRQPRGGLGGGREGRRSRRCSTGSEPRCGCSTRRSAPAGIREIDPVGEPFDPNKHEALSLVPATGVRAEHGARGRPEGLRAQRAAAAGRQGPRGARGRGRLNCGPVAPFRGVSVFDFLTISGAITWVE